MKKLFWRCKDEKENNLTFKYISFINIKFLRQICTLFNTIMLVLKAIIKRKENPIFICDILNSTIAISTLLVCKIFSVKCLAVVTDLPRDINNNKISSKLNQFFQNKFDGYILLTKYMNKIINTRNKPFIVIEGFADIKNCNIENNIRYKEKICLYAGGLYEKYGIKTLTSAFQKIDDKEYKLHFYGNGDMVDYIKCLKSENIKYMGVLKNNEMIKKETQATLLINPRFSDNDYTKYSFPSKNIEYMSTGTPVLTTKLLGMPEEYYNFVYFFDLETVEGFKNTLNKVLSLSAKELHKKGKLSQNFVLKKKNNYKQGYNLKKFLMCL
ncbi:MAG: glycosyltransferase family 4 protein [Tenericutes bacterium]|nr:glycosyltransferase family 4 protein [Mycoplasmatota bacterium]